MNIIREYGISTPVQRYNMTQGNNISKVSEHVGEEINVKAFILYEDIRNDGTVNTVLSIQTEDGDVMASAGYCVRTFEGILSCFGTDLPTLIIGSRRSKGGRAFCFFEPKE